MTSHTHPGGSFKLRGGSLSLNRVGYGTMQLTGTRLPLRGEPKDRPAAIALLREAVELGVNHFDTAEFYGPHVTNSLLREALHPYADHLSIATKVGFRWSPDGNTGLHAVSAKEIIEDVHENLRSLGVEALDLVNLRMGEALDKVEASIEEPLQALADLKRQGLIRHIGLSNVSARQFAEGETITEIAAVQNLYNLGHRVDDALLDELAAKGVAFMPFFPLGGFTPLQSKELSAVATSLDATPMQVALAWLLQRSPNLVLIPGTSSAAHLRENMAAADLTLPADALAELNALG